MGGYLNELYLAPSLNGPATLSDCHTGNPEMFWGEATSKLEHHPSTMLTDKCNKVFIMTRVGKETKKVWGC